MIEQTNEQILFTSRYHDAYDNVSAYTALLIHRIFLSSACSPLLEVGAEFERIAAACVCTDKYLPTLRWALDYLVQSGYLTCDDEVYRQSSKGSVGDGANFESELNVEASYRLMDWVAENWLQMISEQVQPVQVFFGTKGIELWENYFNNAHELYAVHNLWGAREAVRALQKGAEVLEIGAGFGSAALALLEEIERASLPLGTYLATDVSPIMVRRLKRNVNDRFAALPVSTAKFDMNASFAEQALPGARFDVIYAVNAVHCAEHMQETVNRLRQKLKPGGSLILSECVRTEDHPLLHQEFLFTLLPGYLVQQPDGSHRIQGFLESKQWLELFESAGFDQVDVQLSPGRRTLGAIIKGVVV